MMCMRENDIQELIYRYESHADIFGVKVNRRFHYCETVEMDECLLLDFDVNNVSVSLEILDASKRFNLPRDGFENVVFFKMEVSVEEKSISLNAVVCVLLNDIESTQNSASFTSNINNLPNMDVKLALV